MAKKILVVALMIFTLCLADASREALFASPSSNIQAQRLLAESLALHVSAKKKIYSLEDAMSIDVTLQNGGSRELCVLAVQSDKHIKPRPIIETALVGSFGAIPLREESLQTQANHTRIIILAPGDSLRTVLDIKEIHEEPITDHYTFFVRYTPHASLISQFRDEATRRNCQLVSGPFMSNHIRFEVDQTNRKNRVNHYMKEWRKGTPERRWRALIWLFNNELSLGKTEADLLKLLGNPARKRKSEEWIYSVNATGIIISFKSNRIVKMTTFVE